MESIFKKAWLPCGLILLALSDCTNAATPVSQAYAAFSAGYGSYQHGAQGTGSTPAGHIAIGSLWQLQYASLGGEVGIQSGNRMQLSNNVAAAFNYTSASPLYLTIKEPVDILGAIKYQFSGPAFAELKAGGVYLRTMTDSVSISSQSRVLPEIQVGAGYDLTCHTRIAAYYQRYFGQDPTLNDVNSDTGTAKLDHVPTWQAGMISFEVDF